MQKDTSTCPVLELQQWRWLISNAFPDHSVSDTKLKDCSSFDQRHDCGKVDGKTT